MIESSSQDRAEKRYLGITATQLNLGFLAVVGSVVAGVCVWLFVLGGLDSITGGGSEGAATPFDITARAISSEDLGRMALRLDQFPPEYAGFVADNENGPMSLEKDVGQAFDPAKYRTAYENDGWVAAYDASFTDPQPTAGRVFVLDSQLDLFTTKEGAGSLFDFAVAEAGQVGRTKDNLTETKSDQFAVTLADQALGARTTFDVQRDDGSHLTYVQVGVGFRRGRILGSVMVGGFGLSEVQAQTLENRAKELAQKLNDQITSVLSGTTTLRYQGASSLTSV